MSRANPLAGVAALIQVVVGFSCRHPRKICAFFLLLAVGAASLLPGLAINTDTARMLDRSLPFRQTYDAFVQAFPSYDKSVIAVIEAPTAEQAQAARNRLAEAFRTRDGTFEDVQAIGESPYFERYGVFLLDQAEVARLAEGLPAGEALLSNLNRTPSLSGLVEAIEDVAGAAALDAGKWPVLARLLEETAAVLSASGEGPPRPLSWRYVIWDEAPAVETVIVSPALDFSSLVPAERAMAEAREIADGVEATFDGAVTIVLTGQTALDTEELATASGGAALAAGLSFLFVSLVLGLGLRSWVLVAASLASLLIGLTLTAGFATLAIGELNLISVAFAVLFIGLSIDFSIHFALRYQEAYRVEGAGENAVPFCAHELGPALFLCAPTTALAFFSFLVTDFVGMAQLGLISGAGILIALVLSLTFLPALLRLLPPPGGPRARDQAKAGGQLPDLNRLVRSTPLVAVIFMAIAVSAVLARDVRFDADTLALKDQASPSVAGFFTLAERPETSPYALQALVPAEEAASMVAQLKALPLVEGVRWRESFLPQDMAEKRASLEAALASAAWSERFSLGLGLGLELSDREALTELARMTGELEASGAPHLHAAINALRAGLAIFDARGGTTPEALDALTARLFAHLPEPLTAMAATEAPSAEAPVRLPDALERLYRVPDGRLRLEILPREGATDPEAAAFFVDSVKAVVPSATGTLPEIIEAGRVVARAMLEATVVATALVALLLLFVLRSPLAVLLVLLPVAAAALLTLGAMALLGLTFNFANVIVIPLLVGLGIDSGVHLVMRGRQSHSLRGTSTPKAVLLSALTTIGSFGTLALSSHRGTASMGELLALSLFLLLISSLVLLPWVLERPWLRGRY